MPKVVVHVDDVDKVTMAQSNVRNLLAAMPTSEVVIVVNGPAVTTLTAEAWAAFIETQPQVEIDACQNALRSHQLTASDLVAGIQVVPAGVVRIIELEEQGFNYLKP